MRILYSPKMGRAPNSDAQVIEHLKAEIVHLRQTLEAAQLENAARWKTMFC